MNADILIDLDLLFVLLFAFDASIYFALVAVVADAVPLFRPGVGPGRLLYWLYLLERKIHALPTFA